MHKCVSERTAVFRYLFSLVIKLYFYVRHTAGCHGYGLKMANMFVNEEEPEAEDKRPNLLDVIEERNRSLNKVVYVYAAFDFMYDEVRRTN